MERQEHKRSFPHSGAGRGRGHGGVSGGASDSWNPSWLSTAVSPPSFGIEVSPVVGRGRGRANLLASLVSGVGTPQVKMQVPRDVQERYRESCEEMDGGSEEEENQMVQLQQHHAEWKEQMEFMKERGRQLEEAMLNLQKKRRHSSRSSSNQGSVPFSSTHACGQSFYVPCKDAEPVPVVPAVSPACDVFHAQDRSGDLSMWLRQPGSGRGVRGDDTYCLPSKREVVADRVPSVDWCPAPGHEELVVKKEFQPRDAGHSKVLLDNNCARSQGVEYRDSPRQGEHGDGLGDASVPLSEMSLSGVNKSVANEVPSFSVNDLRKAWGRECKIKGTIGKIGEKENKLGYVDVERQIRSHEMNGYPDSEIIDAIINATQSGSTRRTLLQTTDINLNAVKDILHSYFLEAEGGDLVTQLTTAKQIPSQDPQTFLMHCINLKNRIAKLKEEEGGMSLKGATKIMLQTLETGILSERIVNRLMPLLSNPSVTDGELISAMSKAVIAQKGRESKGDKKEKEKDREKKHVNVASVDSKADDDKVLKMVAEIRADVKGLRNSGGGDKKKDFGCEKCCLAGKGRTCTHCFHCGKQDHKYAACPELKSSNSNRSSTRD